MIDAKGDPVLEAYVALLEATLADLRRYVDQRGQDDSPPPPTQQAETRIDDLIEPSAAASRFHIADDTVRLWCRQKKVFSVKDGGRWLVSAHRSGPNFEPDRGYRVPSRFIAFAALCPSRLDCHLLPHQANPMGKKMNVQNILKSLRGGQTNTADQLRQTLEQIDIDGLEAAAEKREVERRRILLDGTDKELEAIETKIAAANRDIERAYAAKAELEKRLESAIAAATEAELASIYNSAKAKADAAAKMLRKEYPDLGRRFVELIRAVAEADVAVEEANKRLPADAAPLWPVEVAVRRRPGSEEKTISEKEVQLWCHASSWDILPDNRQTEAERRAAEVKASGHVPPDGIIHIHGGIRAVKRRFIRRTICPGPTPSITHR